MEGVYVNIHEELIQACRHGDRAAQCKIYKLYYKSMYNTSLRIVNDTAEAEDVMQESFLDAFRKLDGYSGEGSFGSWLKRIVINNSLDSLRKKREQIPLDEVDAELAEIDESDHEEEFVFQVNEVRMAIAQLPEDYRVVLTLYLIEGYDHEEISQILKITNQLSRTRYSRARSKLLSIIRERQIKISYKYN